MLDHWAAAKSTRNHAAECENIKRVLAKIYRHRDPLIPLIPLRQPDPRLQKEVAQLWRQSHIYSPADVRRMLDFARSCSSPRSPLRPLTVCSMLVPTYCAGSRRGELARLDLVDVDLQKGPITVRQTKFFKTRILPLPDSVRTDLRAYIKARRRAGASQDPCFGLFWHEQGRTRRYTPEMITWLLTNVIRRAGLKPLRGRTRPRVDGLRHSMVVNRILLAARMVSFIEGLDLPLETLAGVDHGWAAPLARQVDGDTAFKMRRHDARPMVWAICHLFDAP